VEAQVQEHQLRHLVDDDLRVAQRRSRLRTSFAPTDLVVVEADRPSARGGRVSGLPMSCSSAARRSTRSGPSVSRPIACSSTTSECV
jgi:hypothetical protein